MRCSICDYSEDAPSLFHTGLHDADGKKREIFRTAAGDYQCSVCVEAGVESLLEFGTEDDEEESP